MTASKYTKHRDVVQFYVGRQGWEVTYRGKKPLDKDIVDDYLRRRDHSIETAVKVWMKDPNTILLYEGQHMVPSGTWASRSRSSRRRTRPSPS
jgi:hypothetical protein